MKAMTSAAQRFPVAVVGAGQAGLSISYCLKELGIEHVVLERHRVGYSWRSERWDTFCLVTPNWQCQLPGHPYDGPDPQGFMKTPEIVDYLDRYVARFRPPVRENVEVIALEPREPEPGFALSTSAGTLLAEQVVVATGGYHVPIAPKSAAETPATICQLHSSEYRNSARLPPGAVLVVGTGQSGCQIAEDLHLAGRTVHLAVGNAPRCARRYRGRDVVEWLHDMGYYDMPVDQHPDREGARHKTNHYVTGRDGGRDIDLRQFAREGMCLYGPLEDIRGSRIDFAPGLKKNLEHADDVYRNINRSIDSYIEKQKIDAPPQTPYAPVWEAPEEVRSLDLLESGVGSIVWCIGFSTAFGWVKAPVFDEAGYPRQTRGVTGVDGLYFIGLPWLYTWGSGRFSGVGRDARFICDRIDELRSRRTVASARDRSLSLGS